MNIQLLINDKELQISIASFANLNGKKEQLRN